MIAIKAAEAILGANPQKALSILQNSLDTVLRQPIVGGQMDKVGDRVNSRLGVVRDWSGQATTLGIATLGP